MKKEKLDDKEEFCVVDIGKIQTNGEIRTLTTEIVLKYCTGPHDCVYGKLQVEYNPEKKYIVMLSAIMDNDEEFNEFLLSKDPLSVIDSILEILITVYRNKSATCIYEIVKLVYDRI